MSTVEQGHEFIEELRSSVQGSVLSDSFSRGIFSTDASSYQMMPTAIVMPLNNEDVKAAVLTAKKYKVPILPRGGGTSLAGQTVTNGLILDLSKHMDQVLEINSAEKWVRVQPGVVRDELNTELKPFGLHFAPDPATGNRANIGGMIGTNSSGVRSIVYGKTIDHVLEVKLLLSTGEIIHCKANPSKEDNSRGIVEELQRVIQNNRKEISDRFPSVMRRVSGYNLDEYLDNDDWNLSRLVTGSEGTLGIILEAKINLEPLPKSTAVCVAHFPAFEDALSAVEPLVEMNPSAVEILDAKVIQLARDNLSPSSMSEAVKGLPGGALLIESFGEDSTDALNHVTRMATYLLKRTSCFHAPTLNDKEEIAKVWEVRKSGLGLMLGVPDDKKPIAFIEDACVPLPKLSAYIEQVTEICHAHNTDVIRYAHASVGVLHMRPCLDLQNPRDIEKMKSIASESFQIAKAMGGSWSGEHGDGLARSEFIEPFFGPTIYEAFRKIKSLFDPDGLMNPGKIIDSPKMDENLRLGKNYQPVPWDTVFHFRKERGIQHALQLCNGVGACRKMLSGTMCPSYMVTKDEKHTTRARANSLRLALSGQLGENSMENPLMENVMELCVECKACKSECPSGVDMARLKAEYLQHLNDKKGIPFRSRLLANAPCIAGNISGPWATLLNGLLRTPPAKFILNRFGKGFKVDLRFKNNTQRSFTSRHKARKVPVVIVQIFIKIVPTDSPHNGRKSI